MKQYVQLWLLACISGLIMMSCNSDEGSKTSENNDPGNADSVGEGQTNHNNVGNADADFLSFAAYSGMKEIEEGKAAQSKGQANEVKELGKMMVADHTAMGEKVKALAAKKNVALKESLDAGDMDNIRNKKAGKEFDRDYATEMVDDHEKAVREFENAANNSGDAEVKALANEALPKLRHHLEMSKALRDKLKN